MNRIVSFNELALRSNMPYRQLLSILLVALMLTSCKKLKDNQDFYNGIDNSAVYDSDIHLIGDIHNISVKSQELFVPDNVVSGGYAYASTIRIDDSTLIVACTRYQPRGFDDFKYCDIVAKKSMDNGKTWSEEYLLQKNIGVLATMNPNFVRISSTRIQLYFIVKDSGTHIDIYLKESYDNGITWNLERKINNATVGYHILNNDRVILNKKRIIIPVAFVKNIDRDFNQQVIFCYYSDDYGKTWSTSKYLKTNFALMEPGITPVGANGRLKMTIRTMQGFVYFSTSMDNGVTWNGLYKSNINTPESPQVIKSLGTSDTMLMIWNNTPYTPGHLNRNPLTFAYSINGGDVWQNPRNIKNTPQLNYLYPTIYHDRNDTIMVTYATKDQYAKPIVYFNKLSLKDLIK